MSVLSQLSEWSLRCPASNQPCESSCGVKVFRERREGKVRSGFKCRCSAVLVLSPQKTKQPLPRVRGRPALRNDFYLSVRHISHRSSRVTNSVVEQTSLSGGDEGSRLPPPSASFLPPRASKGTSVPQRLRAQNPRIFELRCT